LNAFKNRILREISGSQKEKVTQQKAGENYIRAAS
jgi:hypothetical protein